MTADLTKRAPGSTRKAPTSGEQTPPDGGRWDVCTHWLRQAALRLSAGSSALWTHGAQKAVLWCRSGYRDDLTGLTAYFGPILRAGGLTGGAYGLLHVVQALPASMYLLTGGWCITAWRFHNRPAAPKEPTSNSLVEEHPEGGSDGVVGGPDQEPEEDPVQALVTSIADPQGRVHLQALYPAMKKQLPGLAEAPPETLRQVLTEAGFPVRKSMRAHGVAGRSGVCLDDLDPAPSPDEVSKRVSTPVSGSGDAGQSGNSPRVETGGDLPETRAKTDGDQRIEADPDHPNRYFSHS